MKLQRFEYSEGASNKFWAVALSGASFTVRFGRIGTIGQEQTKTFATSKKAKAERDKLIAEKVKKGYRKTKGGSSGPTRPQPARRSEPVVYDKAKYHYDGEYPKGLPIEQAFVHTGLFLGWLIDHDLVSEEFSADEIRRFKKRKLTGPEVYALWDGCLVDDMLSDEGNAFAAAYFDFERGKYLADYGELLCKKLPSLYQVADTWENYEKLSKRVDQRYAAWKRKEGRS